MTGGGGSPFRRLIGRSAELAAMRRFETGIPMRDGIELAADVYLPHGTGDGPAPAIVTVTPYGKENPSFTADEAVFYQAHGYAFVAADTRGRGKSEGQWEAFVHDAADTHDVIEWAAAQPWCTGMVGTTGLSYMGWVQWAAASQHPPHLRAMISTSAAGRWQQEIPYTNGVFQLYFGWWAFSTRRRILESKRAEQADWEQILRTLPFGSIGEFIDGAGQTWDMICGHETLDGFWRALRYDDVYGTIDVPCLHVTGWYDLEDLLGAFHHYEHMRAASPASGSQYLLVGPWSHVKSRFPDAECGGVDFGPAAALDMDAEHLRWFDHWLKGTGPGLAGLDPVRIFEPGRNSWRGATRWPLATAQTGLYLGPASLLTSAPAAQASDSYRYDPADPAPTGLDVRRYPFEDVPLEQTRTEARGDVLCYTSDPVTEPVTVSGWPHLVMFASSDGDDTDWHVKLTDVTPDGRSLRVTQGCLRAACRDSLAEPEPLVPGVVYPFDVELWPTHHVFLPGHRIRVTVTSSDFPWFARSLNRYGTPRSLAEPRVASNTVYHGGRYPSRLVLPVEAASAAGEGPGGNQS
ncbi:MAG TPA: CocE/NonD family hydrolase [Streptosporangiaceae bacterium]|nr:CocE/NonD family hydrolase [Streptosporangiaceae bacterium]